MRAIVIISVWQAPRQEELAADSLSGFGENQGENGWHYAFWFLNEGAYNPAQVENMAYVPPAGDQEGFWRGEGAELRQNRAAPGIKGNSQVWAVRRWASTVSGAGRLLIQIRVAGKGSGVCYKGSCGWQAACFKKSAAQEHRG